MNYVQELESYFSKDFIILESNRDYKRYHPIKYVEMLEEMLHYQGYTIKGNRHLETLDKKNNVPMTKGVLTRRDDFNTEPPHFWVKDIYGRQFKWTIYEELEGAYHARYLDYITTFGKKEIYVGEVNGRKTLMTDRIVNIPISCMRFNLTFLRETGNVDYEKEKREELALRGISSKGN